MSMQDPISDLLTRIRNAQAVSHPSVSMYASKLKENIVKVFLAEGYISAYEIDKTEPKKPILKIILKYFEGKPVIAKIRRISSPALRIYRRSDDLPKILGGLGVAVISTSAGVMSDKQARHLNLGGELLCSIE